MEMVKQLQLQFPGIKRLFVLDRCTDNSSSILSDLKESFIENKEGEGFLAGRARDLGLKFLGIENTFFLDGDRIPVNFSVDLVNRALEKYDICLVSVTEDFRTCFTSDFTFNPEFRRIHNDVFSCGLCIRKEMIEKVVALQQGRLFHPAFDGNFGEEDRYLGNVVLHFKGSCGLFPKNCYLKGGFRKIEDWGSYTRQFKKRLELKKALGS
jgi:hypothetical protein